MLTVTTAQALIACNVTHLAKLVTDLPRPTVCLAHQETTCSLQIILLLFAMSTVTTSQALNACNVTLLARLVTGLLQPIV